MNCHFCGHTLIWGCDYDAEELGYDGAGVVSHLSCTNESCRATWEGVWLENRE